MDKIAIGLARNNNIRIYSIVNTDLVSEAQQRHGLWPTASAALGRVLSVTAMMGAMSKIENEKVTIQIKGDGPILNITASANNKGEVRGYVGDPQIMLSYTKTNQLAVGLAVGNGVLQVSRDLGLKNTFVGTTDLISGEIGDDFAYYFNISEQTPSAVSVGVLVDTDNTIISSGGLIIQMMPGASEEDIVAAEKAVESLRPISELVKENKTANDLILDLFDDAKIIEERDVIFKCDCSREKMERGLLTLDKSEIIDMINDNENIETVCNFCNEKYIFTIDDLRKLIDVKEA